MFLSSFLHYATHSDSICAFSLQELERSIEINRTNRTRACYRVPALARILARRRRRMRIFVTDNIVPSGRKCRSRIRFPRTGVSLVRPTAPIIGFVVKKKGIRTHSEIIRIQRSGGAALPAPLRSSEKRTKRQMARTPPPRIRRSAREFRAIVSSPASTRRASNKGRTPARYAAAMKQLYRQSSRDANTLTHECVMQAPSRRWAFEYVLVKISS